MEKTLKPNNDKEYMRMVMQKHEETFKEQVNELHRLYRIQKKLMESVGQQQTQNLKQCNNNLVDTNKRPFSNHHYQQQLLIQQAQREISTTNIHAKSTISNKIIMGLNLMNPDNQILASGPPRSSSNGQEHIAESKGNATMMMLDENEIELTLSLGPSSLNPRRRKMGKSGSGESGDQSLSSSSTGSSQTRKRSPNSNGNNNSRSTTRWASFPNQGGSGIETGFSNGQTNSNPPWLYQALSLKLT